MAKDITQVLLSGSWNGKRCVIVGGGPSLRSFDPGLIDKELVIGINKAFTKFPVTVNYGMDLRFYDELTYIDKKDPKQQILHQKWVDFKGIKLFLKRDNKAKFDDSIYIVKALPNKAISYDLSVGIWAGSHSGMGALMLAIALGCKEIGLLGYDMKVDVVDSKHKNTHWHEGYTHQNQDSLQSKLDKFRKEIEEFAEVINEQGIKVVNLCMDSRLDCFEKMRTESFLV